MYQGFQTKINLSSTSVTHYYYTDNNNKCRFSRHIKMISEGSCDTGVMMQKNIALHHMTKLHYLNYIKIENYNFLIIIIV